MDSCNTSGTKRMKKGNELQYEWPETTQLTEGNDRERKKERRGTDQQGMTNGQWTWMEVRVQQSKDEVW